MLTSRTKVSSPRLGCPLIDCVWPVMKTYKEMCEIVSQQLEMVLESAVSPPEKSIYSEVEMKNMTRVLQDTFVEVLKTGAQTRQLNRALFN